MDGIPTILIIASTLTTLGTPAGMSPGITRLGITAAGIIPITAGAGIVHGMAYTTLTGDGPATGATRGTAGMAAVITIGDTTTMADVITRV